MTFRFSSAAEILSVWGRGKLAVEEHGDPFQAREALFQFPELAFADEGGGVDFADILKNRSRVEGAGAFYQRDRLPL